MSGHRRAAAALHGLSGRDQNAILVELPQADQLLLRRHLDELRTLGFEAGAMRAAANEERPAASRDIRTMSPVERIRAATPAGMLAVLAAEPAALVADFLAIEEWPWASELVGLLAPERRAQLGAFVGKAAPARAGLLLVLAAQALELQPPVIGKARSRLARLRQRIDAWKR